MRLRLNYLMQLKKTTSVSVKNEISNNASISNASIKTYVIKSEREFASNDFLTVLTRIQLHRSVHAELLFCFDVGPTSIMLAVQPWFSIKCVSYSCLLGDLGYQEFYIS